jgi:hypothetical protein
MTRKLLIALVVLIATLAVCSCSRESSESADASDTDSPRRTGARRVDDGSAELSDAARGRGVAPRGDREAEEEVEPQIAIRGFTYEWRLEPEKGLHVRISFVNTRDTYARARGYLFVVASSNTMPSVTPGVYPWDARFEGGYPEKHTDGNRLLFRDELDTRIFIPYRGDEGYYDYLKIIVYHEDGGTVIDLDYELDVTGEPSGPIEAAPMSVTM